MKLLIVFFKIITKQFHGRYYERYWVDMLAEDTELPYMFHLILSQEKRKSHVRAVRKRVLIVDDIGSGISQHQTQFSTHCLYEFVSFSQEPSQVGAIFHTHLTDAKIKAQRG